MAKRSNIVKDSRPPKFSTRRHYRCQICGRPRAYMRRFGVCRLCFRAMAHRGELPGVRKGNT